jgi:hypothetical protein
MSSVSQVILTFSASDNNKVIESAINKFNEIQDNFNLVSIDDEKLPRKWYGGSKKMGTGIFIGAINHLQRTQLIDHLHKIKWEIPDAVQLIIKEEGNFRFKIIDLFPSNEE